MFLTAAAKGSRCGGSRLLTTIYRLDLRLQEVKLLAAKIRIQFCLFQLRLEGEGTCSCHLYQLNTHISGLPYAYISTSHLLTDLFIGVQALQPQTQGIKP